MIWNGHCCATTQLVRGAVAGACLLLAVGCDATDGGGGASSSDITSSGGPQTTGATTGVGTGGAGALLWTVPFDPQLPQNYQEKLQTAAVAVNADSVFFASEFLEAPHKQGIWAVDKATGGNLRWVADATLESGGSTGNIVMRADEAIWTFLRDDGSGTGSKSLFRISLDGTERVHAVFQQSPDEPAFGSNRDIVLTPEFVFWTTGGTIAVSTRDLKHSKVLKSCLDQPSSVQQCSFVSHQRRRDVVSPGSVQPRSSGGHRWLDERSWTRGMRGHA